MKPMIAILALTTGSTRPRWSPDGTRLAFLAKGEGVTVIVKASDVLIGK